MMKVIKSAALAITVLGLLGCSDDSGSSDQDSQVQQSDAGATDGAGTIPAASLKELTAYSTVQGQQSVTTETNTGVTKVELLVDGTVVASATEAPFTITWDTTQHDDGLVVLTLKAHAGNETADSDETTVMVLNKGQQVTFDEAASQSMTVDPALDYHVKVHWTMPAGMNKVIGLVTWDNPDLSGVEIAVGTGGCPHSGTKAADATSTTSPAVVSFTSTGGALAETMWFVHAGSTDDATDTGKSSAMTFKAFVLP